MDDEFEVIEQTNMVYTWLKNFDFPWARDFESSNSGGVIIIVCGFPMLADRIIEEIATGDFSEKFEWKKITRNRIIVFHKDLS